MKAAHAGLTEHYPWRRSRPEWYWCFEWPRAFTFQFKVQASTVLYAVLTGILVTSATISFMGTEASHPIVQYSPFFCPQAVPKREPCAAVQLDTEEDKMLPPLGHRIAADVYGSFEQGHQLVTSLAAMLGHDGFNTTHDVNGQWESLRRDMITELELAPDDLTPL